MISANKKRVKNSLLILLILIIIVLVLLVLFYSGYIDILKNAISGNKSEKDIIDSILINNIKLNYDSVSNTYYLPISLDGDKEVYLDINIISNYNINSKIKDEEFNKDVQFSDIINYETTYQLDVETCLYKKSYYIKFTNLPSISLSFNEDRISREYIYSEFSIVDPDYQINNTQYEYLDNAKVRLRGASSISYSKKSYRIKLERDVDFGMLGMNKSKVWILDSLATDPSNLRVKIASDIWNKINEDLSEEKYEDLNTKFVEVYMNNEYKGLYLLKEVINEDLLNLDDTGVLIKGTNWNKVDFDNYDTVESEMFGPFEMKYPDNPKKYTEAWKVILNKLKGYYDSELSYEALIENFYIENVANYKIFLLIIQGLDNYEYRNMYFSIANNDKDAKALITPWDLDLTFGILWDDEKKAAIKDYYSVDKIVEPFGIHGDDRTVEYYKDRWNFLIENILNKEEINKIIDYQYEYLSKANSLSRENIRNSNLELKKNVNQEEEIIKLKEWYEKRIDVINDYIESL